MPTLKLRTAGEVRKGDQVHATAGGKLRTYTVASAVEQPGGVAEIRFEEGHRWTVPMGNPINALRSW